VTLPRKASNRPWRPAVGMTTIFAPISSATETIVSTMGPPLRRSSPRTRQHSWA
jgi:hypothetical protein